MYCLSLYMCTLVTSYVLINDDLFVLRGSRGVPLSRNHIKLPATAGDLCASHRHVYCFQYDQPDH